MIVCDLGVAEDDAAPCRMAKVNGVLVESV